MDQLNASLNEVQRLIKYRLNGINNFNTLGPGNTNNRYFPAAPPPPPPPAAAELPPPEALKLLKENFPTRFENGQVWTLKDGKPLQVK